MPRVILSPAGGGGLPEGSPDYRYEFDLELDHDRTPRVAAWTEDSWPWFARRVWNGEATEGDVQYDEDSGWAMRFFPRAEHAPDAPLQSHFRNGARFRPGEIVSVSEADGRDYAWRVVSVG